MLGKPDVALQGPDGEQIAAPTAADLAGRGEGWYLNLPGNPLDPGCTYEQWFREVSAGTQPTLYAHLATDPEHPGRIALQYWFYYVFNDWNDKHESDWEMVQVVLPAATAAEALTATPESVAFAQHEGSQVSPWEGGGLIRVGDRPVVYPGQGSHAAYYTQATWFGKSAAAGFGLRQHDGPRGRGAARRSWSCPRVRPRRRDRSRGCPTPVGGASRSRPSTTGPPGR